MLNRIDKTPLYTTIVPADGNVNGSFTANETQNYYVYITANNTTENELTFVLDRFYAYIVAPNTTDYVALFKPDVLAFNDYYPFGSLVPNRHGSSSSYRYGFNGKENDNEIMGEGNFQDYGMRMYNPRIGRFFNVDPLTKKYPMLTPYQFASNTPIWATDLDGLEAFIATETIGTGHAFLVVKTSEELIVYTYGRYGTVDWNQTSGEGVLIRKTGQDAVDFINFETTRMGAKFFEVGDVTAAKIKSVVDEEYFTGHFSESGNLEGLVIDEYSLTGTNCSMHSCGWIIDGGSKIFEESTLGFKSNEEFVIPSSLQDYLTSESKDKNKAITPADDKMKQIIKDTKPEKKLEKGGRAAEASGLIGRAIGSSANSSSSDSSSDSGSSSGSSNSSGSSSKKKK